MKWKTAIFFKSEADKDSTTKEDKLRDFLNKEQIEEFTILITNDTRIKIIYKVNN